ncbi:hypothetical protein [Mangrovicoccus ximenensis]|nr:hypothetical protein [Mangrovicoccus ximenensis]
MNARPHVFSEGRAAGGWACILIIERAEHVLGGGRRCTYRITPAAAG